LLSVERDPGVVSLLEGISVEGNEVVVGCPL